MSHALTARLALAKHEFQFTHALGQNFLLDDGLISRIADAAEVGAGDCVLEIGAGAGVLTAEMASRGASVLALELDRGLAPVLQEVLADLPNAQVVFADAMKADLLQLASDRFGEGARFKVVANLPYYITTDVILRLLTASSPSPIPRPGVRWRRRCSIMARRTRVSRCRPRRSRPGPM